MKCDVRQGKTGAVARGGKNNGMCGQKHQFLYFIFTIFFILFKIEIAVLSLRWAPFHLCFPLFIESDGLIFSKTKEYQQHVTLSLMNSPERLHSGPELPWKQICALSRIYCTLNKIKIKRSKLLNIPVILDMILNKKLNRSKAPVSLFVADALKGVPV